MTENIAIIDLGSNSARLIIMQIYHNGAYNLIYHQKESVRLSEGMSEDGLLKPQAVDRAISTLQTFSHMCQLFKANKILAVATAAVRNAQNGPDFLQLVQEKTGIELQTISGDEEALLGYSGVINTIDITDALLFDLGGGSTELTLIRNRQAEQTISLPFGAVNMTERFGTQDKISENQLTGLRAFITSQLKDVPWLKNLEVPLIGVGGTARNIAKMEQKRKNYPFPKVHNYRLGSMSMEDLWNELIKTTAAQRRKFPGLSSERADIILAGTTIVKCLSEYTKSNQLIISGCGVREGIFLRYYLTRQEQDSIIPDILMHSTKNMLLFYKGNTAHAQHVSTLATTMFDGWQSILNLGHREKTILTVAALLHDIGITINYYDHPRHSAYLVENARLFGLTHREQMLAAVISGWHNGHSAKYFRSRLYGEFLDQTDWDTARKLALILALAETLDTTHMSLVQNVKAFTKNGQALLRLSTNGEASIEINAAEKHTKWFKKEFGTDLIIVE